MRTVAWWLTGGLALVALGCSGGGASSPTAPSTNGSSLPTGTESAPISVSGSLGTPMQQGDLQTSALAIYTVDVNTDTLTATSRLKETRSGQANDDLYMLSIDSFLNAGSFKIDSVAADLDSVDLGYVVTHPFPAPSNPTGTPNGSTNRADLGISGMVLFLADVPSATGNTYFTDVVANTALVTNADAYYSPGGLLTTTGASNTYPYRQLVDEVADSRVGVSNGGNVDGNFGADGWTLSELGGANDGWTGGGVLHGGQSSASTVSLDKTELSGGFSLDVAIIAKYGDPRGGTTGAQKKANRLPPAAADATKFAYRIPHNSLDGSQIVVESDAAGFIANTISAATISVHVVDPDALATETSAADLSADALFQTVAVGESGAPTVEVCIPGVNGDENTVADLSTVVDDDSGYGGDAAADTGAADDALFFQDSVTKAAGAGETDGEFTGMVRVTDPETGLVIGLDGSLAPLPTAPEAITYQAFTITQLPDNAPPSATVTLLSANPMNSGTPAQVGITSIADADSDNLDITVDWGNGGGFVPVVTGLVSPYANQSPSSPNMNNADLVVDAINVVVRLDDGTAQTDYPISYNLGANRPPQVTNTRVLANASLPTPASFVMNAGTGTATDPEGDTISYSITNNVNADVPTFSAFPNAANTSPIVPAGPVNFTVRANDVLHPTVAGTAYPVVVGTVTPSCPSAGATAPAGSLINTFWPAYSGNLFISPDWFYWGGNDFSGWRTPTYPGWVTQWEDNTTRNALAVVNFTPPTTVTATMVPVTGYTGNALWHQVETNATNRVFWVSANSGNFTLTSVAPSTVYAGTTYPQSIFFADYTGAATVAFNTISIAPNRCMAMTVTHSGQIIWIDQVNVMHKMIPTGATTYAEQIGCGFPVNLGVGGILPVGSELNATGVGDLNRKVHDLVVDENNGAILILAQSQGPVVLGAGNGFMYRIEAPGTYLATVNGNLNPRRFVLNTSTTQTVKCDIVIDNYNAAGALLTGQQDNQIVTSTTAQSLAGDLSDIRIWRSDLSAPTLGVDVNLAPYSNTSMVRTMGMDAIGNRMMVTTSSFDSMGWLTGLPTGWQ